MPENSSEGGADKRLNRGGGEGNQSCKIARCSLQHGKPEYCSQCKEFSCEKYENIDEFDSFVTHQNRKKDLILLKLRQKK